MMLKVAYVIVGYICGYLTIQWIPISEPFQLSSFIIQLILHPLNFLRAMLSFFIGFLVNSILIRVAIEQTYAFIKKKKINVFELLICYSVLLSFYQLFQYGFWQTLVFLTFALIYGMISVDLKRNIEYELER